MLLVRRLVLALVLAALAGSDCGDKKAEKKGGAAAGTAGNSAAQHPGPAMGSAAVGSGGAPIAPIVGTGDSSGGREHGDEPRPVASKDLTIAITGVAGESTFTGDKLAALPVIKAPTGDTETPGWNLVDVLHAAGIEDPQVVHLTDGEGATLRIEAADFDPAKTVLYLKLNRSGVIRFRLYRRVGETWEVGGELRGISKIHVVK